jgi:hypothetical protein
MFRSLFLWFWFGFGLGAARSLPKNFDNPASYDYFHRKGMRKSEKNGSILASLTIQLLTCRCAKKKKEYGMSFFS